MAVSCRKSSTVSVCCRLQAVIGALSGSGRGRGAAPLSPMVALSPIRHRAIASPDRILHQTEYSDSAAAALSDAS